MSLLPLFALNGHFVQVKQPPQIKAPPAPHFGLPFQPHLPEDRHLDVCPFSFEEREQERRALKEKRLEERRLEEVRSFGASSLAGNPWRSPGASALQSQVPQFKAQPLPDFDAVVLPEKKKPEATKPEPFRLLVDQRGVVRSTRLEKMVRAVGRSPAHTLSFASQRCCWEFSGERRAETAEGIHGLQSQAQRGDS